jgi:N6-L-threonylcarbamoyladenine synthase
VSSLRGAYVLGIETSCDETAVAVVAEGREIASSVVSSQVDLHARYGGVVPEIASRAHLQLLGPVLAEALERAGLDRRGCRSADPTGVSQIGAVAVTAGPGLMGALVVGVSFAKSLAMALDCPLIGVNHLEGHLYAALLEDRSIELPVVVLLVSGGHTLLIEMREPGRYRVLGATRDDAAGEAFDKVARFLGLSYPGGPVIDRLAAEGDAHAMSLPRPMLGDGLDFSFSGLKTAVVNEVRRRPGLANADVAASFQQAVVEVLVAKSIAAAAQVGAHGICLAGGVAANSQLREATTEACARAGLGVFLPSRAMCTDNAAMIAAAGYHRLREDGPSPLDLSAQPNLRFPASR